MPYTEQSTWQRSDRVKVSSGERSTKARVLHANLDHNSASLRFSEAQEASDEIAKAIAD